jgi:hypothetical protein
MVKWRGKLRGRMIVTGGAGSGGFVLDAGERR